MLDLKTTFIYALKDPITEAVRYVGKSDNPRKRLSSHLGEARDRNCHRKVWLHSLKMQGLRPVLEIVDEVPEAEWQSWEAAYIDYYREAGCDLTNNTNGGDGVVNLSPEARKRMRAGRLGKKHSEETILKMCADRGGENHPMYGKQHTSESKLKVSAAKQGVKTERNTSGFVGVGRCKQTGRWKPHLCVAGVRLHLGRFENLEDAIFVRSLAVDKYSLKTA